MKRSTLLGWGLVVSSICFLWALVVETAIASYGIVTGSGSGVDFAGRGAESLAWNVILAITLLAAGIFVLKKYS